MFIYFFLAIFLVIATFVMISLIRKHWFAYREKEQCLTLRQKAIKILSIVIPSIIFLTMILYGIRFILNSLVL